MCSDMASTLPVRHCVLSPPFTRSRRIQSHMHKGFEKRLIPDSLSSVAVLLEAAGLVANHGNSLSEICKKWKYMAEEGNYIMALLCYATQKTGYATKAMNEVA